MDEGKRTSVGRRKYRLRQHASRIWPYLALVFTAIVVMAPHWSGPSEWGPDGLFYQAQTLELRGQSARSARAEVFTSSIAREVAREYDAPNGVVRVRDPRWVEYAARFYRRRWAVPAMAAGIYGWFGVDSLRIVGLLGYVALGPALYALLRTRFPKGTSFGVALVCLILPPVRKWAVGPGVDSWGLTLEVLALLTAVLAADRGRRWLPPLALVVLTLALTRDATIVVCVAAAWMVTAGRLGSRRHNAVLATTVAAAAPVPLLLPTPVRENLAYVLSGYQIPDDSSWHFIATNYLAQLGRTLEADLRYPTQVPLTPLVYLGLAVGIAALIFLFMAKRAHDPLFLLLRGAVVGSLVFLALANNPQGLRLELVLVPSLAGGLALGVDRFRRATSA